ncbi:MAG: sigma-70 family RNA polymerase sigma factor [Candidatus Didemnitutus sp.]|nr:sigma-70 family RNA polymerase sigma factor [Candidatus Didemnitutus sp.]
MTPQPENDSDEVSDESLMAALQAGDDHALATLMHRWELGVKAFLLRLGVPSSDVEDVAQEAFVRLYQKRDRYRAGAAFKPWLLTLAGNLGRNRLRWRFRRREDSIEAMDEAQPGGFDLADPTARSASDAAEQANLARDVKTAVNALPENLRQAVLCVELEDLSYAEASQVMGCSVKAVETRLYRARELLRTTCKALLGQI